MSSHERFGYEWNRYSDITPEYELQFSRWVYPLSEEDFMGKKVLDAGCGMGRNSYWALKWGADELTAFDLDPRSVQATGNNLKEFNNARVLLKNIYEIKWQDEFDLILSIGVIHHLKEPKDALVKLIRAVKPEGALLFWVYSYEGNEWIVRYFSPVRKYFTSKLPIGMVHLLSYLCSAPLWVFIKLYRGANGYFNQLKSFKFWHIHSIVFDQLIPEVANYWNKFEVADLLSDLNLQSVSIAHPPNGMGWTVICKK